MNSSLQERFSHLLQLSPLCFYCQRPVDPVTGCWIGHGTMAHYECAWAVEEAFWAMLDVGEGADARESS